MELWVRSQDKNYLMKVTNLYIPISRTEEDFGIYTIDTYFRLGTYKSKERALEVLDEIQKLLMPVSEYKREIDDLVINYKNIDTIVYEMPED